MYPSKYSIRAGDPSGLKTNFRKKIAFLPGTNSLNQFFLKGVMYLLPFLIAAMISPAVDAQLATFCDGNPDPIVGIGSTHIVDQANTNTDNQFTQGSKDENEISDNHWSPGSAND